MDFIHLVLSCDAQCKVNALNRSLVSFILYVWHSYTAHNWCWRNVFWMNCPKIKERAFLVLSSVRWENSFECQPFFFFLTLFAIQCSTSEVLFVDVLKGILMVLCYQILLMYTPFSLFLFRFWKEGCCGTLTTDGC